MPTHRAQTLINRAYCIANPGAFAGYGDGCWGLTSCDGDAGYDAFSPTNDRGVIAQTAALSAMPYAPGESLAVLRSLLSNHEARTRFGFVDAFNMSRQWQCAPKARITSGGRVHPESCRLIW